MMRTRSRWLFALALTPLLALSGCVKLDMDMNVRADNTVDGTLIIAVDKAVLAASGQSEADFLKQFETQGPFSGSDRPKQGTVSSTRYDVDGLVGRSYVLKDVPLAEFGGGAGGLTITRKGDRFFVAGQVDMTSTSAADPNAKAGPPAETRIRMTFPGEVLESNGKIDGRTVTWKPKVGEKTALAAEARTSEIIPILLAAVGGAAVFLLFVGFLFFLLSRGGGRRAPAVEYAGAPYDADGYPPAQQPAYPQTGPPRRSDTTQPLPRIDPAPPGPPDRPFGN